METSNPHTDHTDLFTEQPKPLSGTLNVLTILTFIGCGLAYLGTLYNLYKAGSYETDRANLESQLDKIGEDGFAGKMLKSSLEIMDKSYDYRYILFISGLIFTTFCLIGAMKMRKQKKSGLPLYIIGELGPVALTGILIGFSSIMMIIGAVIALIFVFLYVSQRKNLIYN
jgi:high-affinity nickel permease